MIRPELTPEEIATVVDHMVAPRERRTIEDAATVADAEQFAASHLRNRGSSWLVDCGTECPQCGEVVQRYPRTPEADDVREVDGPGWYCDTKECPLLGYKVADLDDRGWAFDGMFSVGRGIAVTQTPRLGQIARKTAKAARRDEAIPFVSWRRLVEHVRASPTPAVPDQLALAL